MRKGGRVFILLGVTLALAAAVLAIFAFRDTSETDEPEEPEVVMVEVVEAAEDIPVNHVLTEDDITVTEVEEDTVSPGTARTPGQVLGLASSGDIVDGQRVLMANLVTPGLSHIVEDGMRAVALPIDRVNALGGMVRAEDHIDLVYSIAFDVEDFYASLREMLEESEQQAPPPEEGAEGEQPEDPGLSIPGFPGMEELPLPFSPGSLVTVATSEGQEPVTKILLQNVRVVRVVAGDITVDENDQVVAAEETSTEENGEDEEAEEGEEESPETDGLESGRLPSADMLILQVDPQAAELIKFILDYEGQFHVALRGPDDTEEVTTTGTTFQQLIEDHGLPMPMPATVPEPAADEEE